MKNRFVYIFISSLLLNYGCKTSSYLIRESFPKEYYIVDNVPFYKQIGNTCGPSALASILSYWKVKFDYSKLVKELYVPGAGGAFDFEITSYPKRFNLWSKYSQEGFPYLRKRIKENIPLIVLYKELPVKGGYHYLVVFGFDDAKEKIIVHTGRRPDVWIDYKSFIKKWREADFGTITICSPERVSWDLKSEDYIYLGYLLEKIGRLKEAEEIYQKLIPLLPGEKLIYFNLGNVYFKMKEFKKAEEAYKKAIELDKNFADAYNNLAYLYFSLKKNLEEAKELVKKAIEINPKENNYLDTLTQIEKEVGDD